ncbi:MAG: hypothetical protein KatS3mg010_1183 [Acidimicrobiia bacterium]|nr:MAG: hypothetical protein KatS3mg010_1183 [Acidimicrobiia bacterium]
MTLELGGDISGVEFLVGWDDALFPDGGPIPGGVRVRQITAVLDLGFVVADTGSNVAVAVVSGRETTGHDVQAGNGGGVRRDGRRRPDRHRRRLRGRQRRRGARLPDLQRGRVGVRARGAGGAGGTRGARRRDAGARTDRWWSGPRSSVPGRRPRPPQTPARTPERAGATLPVTGGDARSTIATALGMLALGGLFASRRRRPVRRVVR